MRVALAACPPVVTPTDAAYFVHSSMLGHEYQDACSLELATRIANGLPTHPEWIQIARDNLARWKARNRDAPGLVRCYDEWAAILELPIPRICEILTQRTDEGQRLRQNAPFPGVIPYDEVWAIKQRIRAEMEAAKRASQQT